MKNQFRESVAAGWELRNRNDFNRRIAVLTERTGDTFQVTVKEVKVKNNRQEVNWAGTQYVVTLHVSSDSDACKVYGKRGVDRWYDLPSNTFANQHYTAEEALDETLTMFEEVTSKAFAS